MSLNKRTFTLLTAPIAFAVALSLGVTAPAEAASTKKNDPRNDPYIGASSTGLDLASVQLKTANRNRKLKITFQMHEPVTTSLASPSAMAAEFVKNKRTLRSVSLSAIDGVLQGEVCSYDLKELAPPPTNCSPVEVSQSSDAKTFRVTVDMKKIKTGAKVLKWYAVSNDMSTGVATVDRVGGGLAKPLRWKL